MKSVRMVIIHGPASTRVTKIATSFGTNDRVISLIWVAAWKMLMMRPVASAAMNSGADTSRVTSTAWRPSSMTAVGVMVVLLGRARLHREALHQRADQQRPAVDQHEQHDLERQRHDHRRSEEHTS